MNADADDRRDRLFSLVHNRFAGDTAAVATVIEERTPGAKVSVRTIQAWLMPPGRASSRNCPPWALKALDDFVGDPTSRTRLEALAQVQSAAIGRVMTATEQALNVQRRNSVELATSQIEEDERALQRWQDLLGKAPGQHIFELERRLDRERRDLSAVLSALHQAVYRSSSFEEFRECYLELERANRWVQRSVNDTRQRIEEGSEEFASNDAVLRPPVKG